MTDGHGKRVAANWPAVPANSTTIIMFATHTKIPTGGTVAFEGCRGVIDLDMGENVATPYAIPQNRYADIDAIELVWLQHNKAAAANGVRLYARDNTGAWRETDHPDDLGTPMIGPTAPITVGALAAGTTRRILIDVSRYIYGWAIEYTAGADNPENWSGAIVLHLRNGVVVR